jgi:hypothetical protein
MKEKDAIDLSELSNAFELLADERRLYAILRLREAESRMTVHRLATEIAAYERDTCPDDISEEAVTRVYLSLLHTHLPRLHQMKVIEYHRATEYLVFSNNSPAVETIIDAVSDEYPSLPVETPT